MEETSSKIEKLVVTKQMREEIEDDESFKLLATIVGKYFDHIINSIDYDLLIQFYYRMADNRSLRRQKQTVHEDGRQAFHRMH